MSHSKVTCRHCGAAYWDGDAHTCPYNVTCPRCGSVYASNTPHVCPVPAAPSVPPPPTLSADAQALLDVLRRQLTILRFFAWVLAVYLIASAIGALLFLVIANS